MKILKNGKVITNTQVVKCWKCSAKLEVEASDLLVYSDDIYNQEEIQSNEQIRKSKPEYAFVCPCCQRENTISKLNENLEFALGITR